MLLPLTLTAELPFSLGYPVQPSKKEVVPFPFTPSLVTLELQSSCTSVLFTMEGIDLYA